MRLVHFYWRLTGQHRLSAAVRGLCETHDAAYFPGGSALDRVVADAALMVGVARLDRPVLARMMLMGISLGGVWWLPFGWRWGYGWRWPRGYR